MNFLLSNRKMTQVKLDKSVAEDLITSKMRTLQGIIDDILQKWNYASAKEFLEDARNGTISNAEDDAIELRQLLLDYKRFQDLLKNL